MDARNVHVDALLSGVANAYEPKGFIAPALAPIIPVAKQSGLYPSYPFGEAFLVHNTARAEGTAANRFTRSVGSDSYYCRNFALATDITDETRSNADEALRVQLESGTVNALMNGLMLDWEKRLADKVLAVANVGSGATNPASGWSAITTGKSNPVADIFGMVQNVRNARGIIPNRMVMGWKAWHNFRQHADVVGLILGVVQSSRGELKQVTPEGVQAYFQLDRFDIGQTAYNSAGEGLTATLTDIWDDACLVYYAPLAPSITEPSYMYSFRWRPKEGDIGRATSGGDFTVSRYREQLRHTDVLESMYFQDERIVDRFCAALVLNCNSAAA